MKVTLWDELDIPDVECAKRFYCAECRRRTMFTRDLDGVPVCREHNEELEEA